MRMSGSTCLRAASAVVAALCVVGITAHPTAADPDPDPAPQATTGTNGTAEDLDAGLVGTASRPDRDVAEVKDEQEVSARAAQDALQMPTGFTTSTDALHPIAPGLRPYDGTAVTSRTGFGTVDAEGVRMFVFPGITKAWNHPVAQAQYALANLNSYRLTQDPAYLDIAKANAQRLVDRAVTVDDAWFFPYDFDFAIHGDTAQELKAPWYSAMAQGQALSVFTRLWEVTDDPAWREAMDHTFASFLVPPSPDAPFVAWVDSGQHLWLEEYPRYPADHGERVLNGHIFTIFGLYDYWSATDQPDQAAQLILGGISTVERTALSAFRQPLGPSLYSLNHRVPHPNYHAIHIQEFLLLWRITHDPAWLVRAQAFESDFPSPKTRGVAELRRKVKQRLYRVNSSLAITRTRTVRLKHKLKVEFSSHFRTAARGPVVMRISKGRFKGWCVKENPKRAWARGAIDRLEYSPRPRVVLAPGRYTAVRLGSHGGVRATRTLTLRTSSSFVTSESATVRGSRAVYARNGSVTGYWVLIDSRTTLRPYGN